MEDIMNLLDTAQVENANREVSKRLIFTSLGKEYRNGRSNLHQTARLLELAALDKVGEEADGAGDQLDNKSREFGKSAREVFENAFQVHRVLPWVHSRSVETETKKSCKARPWRVP